MTTTDIRPGLGASLASEALDFEDFFENSVAAMHWVGADGTILRANQAELDRLSPYLLPEDWIVITVDSSPLPAVSGAQSSQQSALGALTGGTAGALGGLD